MTRQDLAPIGAARRIEIGFAAVRERDGLDLVAQRVSAELRDPGGGIRAFGDGAPPSPRDASLGKLLESLHGARIRLAFDPARGVTAVEGMDRALDAAVARDASLDDDREGLRQFVSDDAWTRALAAGGLGELPRDFAAGAAVRRAVPVDVPGRGRTTIVASGRIERDRDGAPAVRLTGRLAPNAEFTGERGPVPPDDVGEVDAGGVTGDATTTYLVDRALPLRGEWTLTLPFAGGLVQRRITSFTLVRR